MHIRDFIDRNFVFEVLVTFGPDDEVTHIGIGSERQDGSANRRAESVFVVTKTRETKIRQLNRKPRSFHEDDFLLLANKLFEESLVSE